jgi:hypothetical protein
VPFIELPGDAGLEPQHRAPEGDGSHRGSVTI